MVVFAARPTIHQGTAPDQPLRIVVPFAAGGSTDVMARMFAQQLSESFKVQVVVQTLEAVNSCRVGRLDSASGHQQWKVLL